MKQFFIGENFMQQHHHCVMVDDHDRGVLHFIATKKELDLYAEMNGGKVNLKTGHPLYPTNEIVKEQGGLT